MVLFILFCPLSLPSLTDMQHNERRRGRILRLPGKYSFTFLIFFTVSSLLRVIREKSCNFYKITNTCTVTAAATTEIKMKWLCIQITVSAFALSGVNKAERILL